MTFRMLDDPSEIEGYTSAVASRLPSSARIAALVGGYRLGAGRVDELADMAVEVIDPYGRRKIA